jgi:hypothetical protein
VRTPGIVGAFRRILEEELFDEAPELCLQQQVIHGATTPVVVVVVEPSEEREAALRRIAASEGLELAETGPSMSDRYVLMQPESEVR